MAQILDGNRVRDAILEELKPRVAALPRPPGLAVVLVGHDPASEIYVRNKVKACADLGIYSAKFTPPSSISTEELLYIVDELNRRPEIDGILVQMPLPPQVDSKRILLAVSPEKDVDGFHPCNVGTLVTGRPGPKSCTPAGHPPAAALLQDSDRRAPRRRGRPQRHCRQADGDAAAARECHCHHLPLAKHRTSRASAATERFWSRRWAAPRL